MKIYLDLSPAYIPFVIQCTKSAGDKIDPTVDNLIIYEEGGADAVFDSTQITGSPFNPDKVNAKTGLWGVLVAKSAFTAGKWYIALWEMTVDSITTAKVERYFACNASQFKADVSNLDVAVSSRLATAGYTTPDNASITAIKTKTDNLPADPASNTQVNTRLATAGYTAPDNTSITAIKAKTDNLPTDPASNTQVNTRLATAGYTAPDNASITTIKVKTDQLTFTTPNKVDATTVVSSGTNAVTITVYEHGTVTPIPGYNLDLYNAAETVFFGTLVTDINGQAQTNLNDGTYHLRGQKAQFIPDNPAETFVVDSTHLTKTIYATAFTIASPAAGLQTLYGNVRRLNWAVATGDIVKAIIASKQLVNDTLISSVKLEATVDANSQFQLTVPQGAKIKVIVEDHGEYEFTVTTDLTRDIADYLA